MNRFSLFLDQLRRHADLPCMDCEGRRFSYADLLNEVSAWQEAGARLPLSLSD